MARADGLHLDAENRLTAHGAPPSSGLRLEAWLRQLAALPAWLRGSFGDTFKGARSGPDAVYSVQCCPLERGDPLATDEGAHHIVFVTDPGRLDLPTPAHLQRQFALTPAEARVTLAMMAGGSYKEMAGSLGVSEETVRTQISAAYAKTRTANKAALTRLVVSLARAIV